MLLRWREVEQHHYLQCNDCGGVLIPRPLIDAVKADPPRQHSTNPMLAALEAVVNIGSLLT